MSKLALGVDIGGTNARAAVIERNTGALVAYVKKSLKDRHVEAVAQEVAALLSHICADKDVGDTCVGIGIAGMLQGNVVVNAPNLGWRNVDVGGVFTHFIGRQVCMLNDLSAAAWGERSVGAAQGAQHVFTVFVGTGVGSAIIIDGRLVYGATGVAGEFGHIKINLNGGRLCGCGDSGCLEAYVGGAKLSEWMREEGLRGTPSDLEAMAQAGDSKACQLYDYATNQFALAIAREVTVLNPEVVVLGGGVLSRCPGMCERVRHVVKNHAGIAARQAVSVELARLGDDSGLIGAALLAAESPSA